MLGNHCEKKTGKLDIIVIAQMNSTELGFSSMTQVPIAAVGNTVADFPSGWRTDFSTTAVTYSNEPSDATAGHLYASVGLDDGQHWVPSQFILPALTLSPGGTANHTYTYAANGFGTSFASEIDFSYGTHYEQFLTHEGAITADVTIDLASHFLPEITSLTIDTQTDRPVLAWTFGTEGSLAIADYGYVGFSWPTGYWYIEVDPNAPATIQVPQLPDQLAAARPPTDGSVTSPSINMHAQDYTNGYDQARQRTAPDQPTSYERTDAYYH
jgi:hypothetical protein